MTRLAWDAAGARVFTAGVDRGVLYPIGRTGVAWNGLTKVSETPAGGTVTPRFRDGEMVANDAEPEYFAATLSAMTYPLEFEAFDGTGSNGKGLLYDMQPRLPFHLSWRTGLGNDLEGVDFGYRLHLLYNAMASPSPMDYNTLAQTNTPGAFSWSLSATPITIPGRKPTPHLIIDSRYLAPLVLNYIEGILYGTPTSQPRMPTASELSRITTQYVFRKIIQNKSGWMPLVDSDEADLMGYADTGRYSITPNSRLVSAGKPGFYVLEK